MELLLVLRHDPMEPLVMNPVKPVMTLMPVTACNSLLVYMPGIPGTVVWCTVPGIPRTGVQGRWYRVV